MVLAVAIVSVAAGTVAKFQIGIGNIRFATDGAAVCVRCFGLCCGGLIGTDIEGNYLGLLSGSRCFIASDHATEVDAPGKGDDIQNVLSEEQEIIRKRNQTEEVVGEGKGEKIQQYNGQIKQGKDPGFYGDNKEQKEMGVGIHGGIAQKQTQIQIGNISTSAKNKTVHIHQNKSGEIKQIEFQSTPDVFHSPSQRPITEQRNGDQKKIAVAGSISEGIGEQTPDLSLENAGAVIAQKGIECVVTCHLAYQIDNGSTNGNIEHQVGDALVAICVAESLKARTKIFQVLHS